MPGSLQERLFLLVATRKGLFTLHADDTRSRFRVEGPHFLGHVIHHALLDPRDGRTMLVAARTGHLGPTVFRSNDFGKSWAEAAAPPRFSKAPGGRAVDHVFWLTPGHADEPDVWYAGTSPQGLFRSEDGGSSWQGVTGLNEHPMYRQWTGDEQDGTPDGPKLHSILVDPREPRRLYVGMSSGGVFTSEDRAPDPARTPTDPGCVHHLAFAVSQATFKQAVGRLDDREIRHSGVKDRGFMDSIYFEDPLGLLIELASYRFEPPVGHTHADVLLEAHQIRVARGDYNIAPVHLADAIETLITGSRVSLSEDRSARDPWAKSIATGDGSDNRA